MASESTAKSATSITEHLHEELLKSSDVEEFLDELARVSARNLSEAGDEVLCGITLLRPRKSATIASSGTAARALSQIEYQSEQGPGMAASLEQVTVHVPDVKDESRWPEYCEAVLAQGIHSVLAIPFQLEGETKATLLLYSHRTSRFEARVLTAADGFVRQTSLALRLAVRFAHYSETAAHLRATLESRTVIDMAVGIIMAQNRCSQQEAFELLKAASSTRNSKLHIVAAAVVNALGQEPVQTHYDG
ncbi:GAF and ANTAR domain-containing protein [Pseudarthrobacter sp. AL07]|uniref:GAF and ANTAR domain-containing protein n=1 Tax=unclassified Pseudarthrobacter TaxID=2647000 RepID=UPI00249A6C71|nr:MULTISPECIES: GAF and ANTAR domain-containing protein [unclassified Pseudarthrobacter]MDI3194433.1 GAF and ANTAR domain-containing protein [Pseudarthrobacter sp. AL20]MDI3208500.1 GAF and ANTAR domain-containing protein [Pseudarthrobacter sp. AL07]